MAIANEHIYTSDDYWNLPDGERAELINGELYDIAPPNRMHQKLVYNLGLTTVISKAPVAAPAKTI